MPDGLAACGIIQSVVRRLLIGLGAISAISLPGAVDLSAAASERPRSCPHPTVPVPPNEPVYRSGPTEVVSGFYIQGGPAPVPPCKPEPRGPYAATIRVINPHTGATVARQRVKDGHLAHIAVAPGTYKLSTNRGVTFSPTVKVRRGYKVRQDLFEDVP